MAQCIAQQRSGYDFAPSNARALPSTGFRPPFGPGREMAAPTPDGARTAVNGQVNATISKDGVIIEKTINSSYSGCGEPDRAPG